MASTTIKLTVSDGELRRLTDEAAALGIHRSALIRSRALGAPSGASKAASAPMTPEAYRKAVEAAARTVSGVPRVHLEALVAAVLTSLHANA